MGEAQMGPPPMGPAPGLPKHLAVLKAPTSVPLGLSVRGHQDSVKASSPATLHPRTAPVNRGCFPRNGQRVMATARAAGYHQIRTWRGRVRCLTLRCQVSLWRRTSCLTSGKYPPLWTCLSKGSSTLEEPVPFPRDLGEPQLSAAQLL